MTLLSRRRERRAFRQIGIVSLLLLLFPLFADLSLSDPHTGSQTGAALPTGPIPGAPRAAASGVDPYAVYSAEPAPMGMADFGVGPTGSYQYSTNSSLGTVSIVSLSTRNATGGRSMSFQLNLNLHYTNRNKLKDYWVQDVAIVDTSTNQISFYDNIWNHTTPTAVLTSTSVTGNGRVATAPGIGSYYVDAASLRSPGNGLLMTYPASFSFRLNSTVVTGKPSLTFEYNDGQAWVTFDRVTFASTAALNSLAGFTVNGFAYNGFGTYDDAELIMGGPYGGTSTAIVQSDVRIQLKYWNGHNYQSVESAYNFGSDTAETVSNARSRYFYYPDSGEVIADVTQGAGTVAKLFDTSTAGVLDVRPGFSAGILSVRNASNSKAVPAQYPFVSGEAILVVYPGTYLLQTYMAGTFYRAGTYTVAAGQLVQAVLGQVALTANFAIVGGGTGYSSPTITYLSNGVRQTAPLTGTPSTFFIDSGSQWSVSTLLAGSTSSERWATGSAGGVANDAQTVTVSYYHQLDLSVSFTLGGGGTPGSPNLSYGSFGTGTTIALSSFPQTIWSDSGSTYSATNPLPGSSSQERWFSTMATGTPAVASQLALAYNHQYFLSVSGGVLASQWYDSSSTNVLAPQGTYNRTATSGERVVSYSLDSGAAVRVTPSKGALNIPVIMDGPHSIAFDSVPQYLLTLGQGAKDSLVSITPPPIAGDTGWYDSGSQVMVSSFHTWATVPSQSRMNALGYTLDGVQTSITRASGGTFNTTLVVTATHAFDVIGVKEYFINLNLLSSSGMRIVPTTLLVSLGTPAAVDAKNGTVWADSGSFLTVASVVWHGSQVKPGNFSLEVTGPSSANVPVKVYDATIRVTDLLGLPVGGAQGQVSLANGTTITRAVAADGTIDLAEIPIGTFNATISSFGQSVQVLGNAASEPRVDVTVVLSPLIIGIIIGVFAASYATLLFLRRRRSGRARPTASPAAELESPPPSPSP